MNLPLVSILIPTYNRPIYFEQALKSAISQTYPNIEIIICDDSTNNETYEIVSAYTHIYPFLKYFKNEQNVGGKQNFQLAFQRSTGEYINYLMDDDLFHPQKIERMMDVYLQDINKEIKIVTSYRQPIDDFGNNIPDLVFTKKQYISDTILDGIKAGNSMITVTNWIGEPTTVLFRKKDLTEPFGQFCGYQYDSAVDMASWLSLLSQGKALYITDTLSYLRMHSSNVGKNASMRVNAAHDWVHMLYHCPQKGFLKEPHLLQKSLKGCLRFIDSLPSTFPNQLSESEKHTLLYYKNCLIRYEKEIGKYI
ncbi:glycosyltransferase [Bacillus cereus group sp. BfR-BA-01380]|uniref:glycosyltransferase family 2 protein n=1 Tax=Bacillus cereus group sp. BfR-BA-01380 TaxID=2920324 RepID=UPI001F58AFE5|nr:glycosyltransferase [Bacillus cereus group sp. BfR-BA-01380]